METTTQDREPFCYTLVRVPTKPNTYTVKDDNGIHYPMFIVQLENDWVDVKFCYHDVLLDSIECCVMSLFRRIRKLYVYVYTEDLLAAAFCSIIRIFTRCQIQGYVLESTCPYPVTVHVQPGHRAKGISLSGKERGYQRIALDYQTYYWKRGCRFLDEHFKDHIPRKVLIYSSCNFRNEPFESYKTDASTVSDLLKCVIGKCPLIQFAMYVTGESLNVLSTAPALLALECYITAKELSAFLDQAVLDQNPESFVRLNYLGLHVPDMTEDLFCRFLFHLSTTRRGSRLLLNVWGTKLGERVNLSSDELTVLGTLPSFHWIKTPIRLPETQRHPGVFSVNTDSIFRLDQCT